MNAKTKLKPCPFCGIEMSEFSDGNFGHEFALDRRGGKSKCILRGQLFDSTERKIWNTLKPSAGLVANKDTLTHFINMWVKKYTLKGEDFHLKAQSKLAKEIYQNFGVPAGREVSVDRIIWHMKDVLSKKTDVDALTFHCEIGYGDLVSIATTIKKALESGGI